MGRKHVRAGKHIFLCIAGVIIASFFGCATLKEMENRYNASRSLVLGQKLLTEGKYEEALKENQGILAMFTSESPGDKALFNMGLIYAHYDNPGRDYKKSRSIFASLIKNFPESPLIEQAKIWESVFDHLYVDETVLKEKEDTIEKLDNQISDLKRLFESRKLLAEGDYKKFLKENREVLSRKVKSPEGDEALFNLGLLYAHYENPDKDFKKSVDFFNKLIKEYPQSPLLEHAKIWLGVLNVIEESKQVDIEIEEKKKELAR